MACTPVQPGDPRLHRHLNLDLPRGRIGSYLAGFVFEHLGESERALRYYRDVLDETPLRSLDEPVARKARRGSAEVLVVVGAGRAPIKVPQRLPVGAAIGLPGTAITGDLRVLQHSVFKAVVYPLVQGGTTYRILSDHLACGSSSTHQPARSRSASTTTNSETSPPTPTRLPALRLRGRPP